MSESEALFRLKSTAGDAAGKTADTGDWVRQSRIRGGGQSVRIGRRSFGKLAALAAGGWVAGLEPFGQMAAYAQSASTDYRALVCVYLGGGNDANNMIVPTSASEYAAYTAARNSLALAPSALTQLSGIPFAMHAAMPGLAALFARKQTAVLANVGTLVQPMTAAEYRAGTANTPESLFSHADQSAIWQNGFSSSSMTQGWGGRIADLLGPPGASGDLPMVFSMAGSSVFTSGQTMSPAVLNPYVSPLPTCTDSAALCAARSSATQQMLQLKSGLVIVQADRTIESNALHYASTLATALKDAPSVPAGLNADSFSQQLGQVAQLIALRGSFAARRQIFFVTLGGFDTHSNQLSVQAEQLTSLSNGLSAFHAYLAQLGMASNVTSFTVSEFSRTLMPTGTGGTDHAWGGHQLITGGAVTGGKVYGTFPTLALNGPDDADGSGRWVPTTGAAQYAATLATWFGVPASSLPAILPVLPNFKIADLGFFG